MLMIAFLSCYEIYKGVLFNYWGVEEVVIFKFRWFKLFYAPHFYVSTFFLSSPEF